jgi:hypothetical protein
MVIKTIDFFPRTNIMYCQSIFQHTVLYKISRTNELPRLLSNKLYGNLIFYSDFQ